jgi:transcriptional regulator with XRE-family HTH domain
MGLFSRNLRYLRKKGNYNQDEISMLFNKQANTIGNWENQKSEPSIAELMKLGEYFKVSLQELLLTDLEAEALHQNSETKTDSQAIESGTRREAASGLTNEGGQDAFWLILKELRAVNERLDFLVSQMGFASLNKVSDKSAH